MSKFQLVYRNAKPHGIRNDDGFVIFFAEVVRFPNQEERYRQELVDQLVLVELVLFALNSFADRQPLVQGDENCCIPLCGEPALRNGFCRNHNPIQEG